MGEQVSARDLLHSVDGGIERRQPQEFWGPELGPSFWADMASMTRREAALEDAIQAKQREAAKRQAEYKSQEQASDQTSYRTRGGLHITVASDDNVTVNQGPHVITIMSYDIGGFIRDLQAARRLL